jgi:hypothetical protein
MRFAILIALMAIFALPNPSLPGTPEEDFHNDTLLEAAIADIQKMPVTELRALTLYMASCQAAKSDSIKDFFCERDRQKFLIEYYHDRSIDRLIFVLSVMQSMIDFGDKQSKASSKERREMVEAIMRYEDVNRRLLRAINRRFHQLRQ